MTQHEQRMKQLENGILRVRRETELIQRVTEQLRQDLPHLDGGSIAGPLKQCKRDGRQQGQANQCGQLKSPIDTIDLLLSEKAAILVRLVVVVGSLAEKQEEADGNKISKNIKHIKKW